MNTTGQYQTAVDTSGNVYYSNDYGSTWQQSASNVGAITNYLAGISISSNGKYQTIANGKIYCSTNYGITWSESILQPSYSVFSVSVNSDGNYQVSSGLDNNSNYVFYSTNFGQNWYTASNATYVTNTNEGSTITISGSGKYTTVVGGSSAYYSILTAPVGPTGAKTFVIDHPIYKNKHLVHACLEGPEAGVYYRGKSEVVNDSFVEIMLPEYVSKFAYDFTIQITPIYNFDKNNIYNVSEIKNNKFKVFGKNGEFFWIVYGKRLEIEIEPIKSIVEVSGDGPYTWISNEKKKKEKCEYIFKKGLKKGQICGKKILSESNFCYIHNKK